jgi:hypothetical protein
MTITKTPYWEELNSLIGEDRRRERRIPLTFPVEVNGFDRQGRYFSERTTTTDVSEWGCRLQLAAEVEPGTVVALRIVSRSPEKGVRRALLFQIVWVEWGDGSSSVGAAKLQTENIWNMAFPGEAEKGRNTSAD